MILCEFLAKGGQKSSLILQEIGFGFAIHGLKLREYGAIT